MTPQRVMRGLVRNWYWKLGALTLSLLLWFAIIVTSRLIGFVGPEY